MKKKMISICILSLLMFNLIGCNNNDGYYVHEVMREYKYKLELTGTLPNEKDESTIIVYSNEEDLTFEQVVEVMFQYSPDSEEVKPLDIYIESIE